MSEELNLVAAADFLPGRSCDASSSLLNEALRVVKGLLLCSSIAVGAPVFYDLLDEQPTVCCCKHRSHFTDVPTCCVHPAARLSKCHRCTRVALSIRAKSEFRARTLYSPQSLLLLLLLLVLLPLEAQGQSVTTLAGAAGGTSLYADGIAGEARFNIPTGVAVAQSGDYALVVSSHGGGALVIIWNKATFRSDPVLYLHLPKLEDTNCARAGGTLKSSRPTHRTPFWHRDYARGHTWHIW